MASSVEAPNTLLSNTRIKIVDLITEGPSPLFWPQSGSAGNNPLCSIYFDGVPLLNGDGSPNYNISGQGFNIGYVTGSPTQVPMSGFEKVEAAIPLPSNTRVTNPPLNSAFPNTNGGYPKPVVTSFNTTMYPDAEGLKITLRFPAVYTINSDNGNTDGYNITWAVDISLNNGPFVTVDTKNLTDITPNPKCTSPYYNTQVYTLPKTTPAETYYEWKVRVRRVSQNILSVNTQNEMFVDSMSVISSNTYRYPMSALVGLELSADQFAGIPIRAYDTKGISILIPDGYTPVQYNINVVTRAFNVDIGDQNVDPPINELAAVQDIFIGATVEGPGIPAGTVVTGVDKTGPSFNFSISQNPTATTAGAILTITNPWVDQIFPAIYPTIWTGGLSTRKWTNNPAWIFYDLVTNKRYGLGQYIRPEWIDKWTIYQIGQYCDEMVDDGEGGLEPRFTCNVAIQDKQDAYTLLNNLVSVFRGLIYWANGRIFPVGSENRDPVFNFTNANVIQGAFTYSDTPRNTRATVCVVKWTDPSNLFRTTPERLEDIDGITRFGYIEKNLTAFATTSRGQAMRVANWVLTVEQLLTETISFQTDMEGLYLRPGDVFNVYDNYRNNQQQGGRLLDFSTGRDTIHLDKKVNLATGFTYFMSALVPATNLTNPDDITGSDQISLIRNSQIEVRKVTTGPSIQTQYLSLESGFTSGIYKGSVWLLSASGLAVTVFDQATQYKCLSTAEPNPGIVEVVGLKYQTGVNYRVNNNYSVITSPPIVGDTTPPAPPTGITGVLTTGLQIDNSFYSYLYLYWTGSTSQNTAYYKVSGQVGAQPFLIGQPTTTGINYTPTANGNYTFSVAAVNANGYESAFNRYVQNVPATNPLGITAALSGVYIAANEDVYYIRPQDAHYTGYVGTAPSFGWHITLDNNDNQTPTAQFITGYRARLLKLDNESTVLSNSDISISGADNVIWNFDPRYLYTGTTVKPLRGFTFAVDTIDEFGNVVSGARLAVNNPQLPPPLNSGFLGFNGGISYNVTPRPQSDTSGIYLWCSQNPGFIPTYDNVQFVSSNLAGNAQIAFNTGSFYTWFSLVDTYGFSGSLASNGDYNAPIYGPISGNADQLFGTAFTDITTQLTGAFGYLTGAITTLQGQIATTGQTLLFYVYGLSGSITGAGAISTALNVTLQTAVVSASGANATQINAVSARLVTTGQINYALAGTVMDALATTGGANSAYLTQLSAVTTGQFATTKIMAQAFVTGNVVNGTGGAALARWGFELDANGKVTSMVATSAAYGATYGTIVFGGADLQSNTYTPGSVGWLIKANGDVEFGNGVFRGVFTGGAGSSKIAINNAGFTVGNLTGPRTFFPADGSNFFQYAGFGGASDIVTNVGSYSTGPAMFGAATFYQSGNSSATVIVDAGDPFSAGGNGALYSKSVIRTDGNIYLAGRTQKITSDTWSPPLFDGGHTHEFKWDGTFWNVRIDGTTTLGPKFGGSFITGFGGKLDTVSSRFDLRADGTNSIALSTSSTQRWIVGGTDGHLKALAGYNIQNLDGTAWSVPLVDGSNGNLIQFQASAGQIFGRINGGGAILLG